MTDVGADEDLLPPYLPLGLYRVTFTAFIQQKNNIDTLLGKAILRMSVLKNIEKRPTRSPRVKF